MKASFVCRCGREIGDTSNRDGSGAVLWPASLELVCDRIAEELGDLTDRVRQNEPVWGVRPEDGEEVPLDIQEPYVLREVVREIVMDAVQAHQDIVFRCKKCGRHYLQVDQNILCLG